MMAYGNAWTEGLRVAAAGDPGCFLDEPSGERGNKTGIDKYERATSAANEKAK
jgi:hypothetical protein